MRTVYFSDGLVSQGQGGRGDIECEIRAGDICIVEPHNPRNKANGHRGRVCEFTGKSRERGHSLLAHVQFQDEKGGYGYIDPSDLKPYTKP